MGFDQAISMAGHYGLDNLIMVYDNNAITVDGNIDECFTDDTSAKLRATGWEVIDVYDGSNDVRHLYHNPVFCALPVFIDSTLHSRLHFSMMWIPLSHKLYQDLFLPVYHILTTPPSSPPLSSH
jgi:hypothetical protein